MKLQQHDYERVKHPLDFAYRRLLAAVVCQALKELHSSKFETFLEAACFLAESGTDYLEGAGIFVKGDSFEMMLSTRPGNLAKR